MIDGLRGLIIGILANSRGIRVLPALHCYRRQRGMVFHPYSEFLYQIGGRNRLRLIGDEWVMEPGDAVLIPAGVPHAEKVLPGGGEFCHQAAMFDERRLSQHLGRGRVGEPPDIDGSTVIADDYRRQPPVYRMVAELVALGEAAERQHGLQVALCGALIDQLERRPETPLDRHPLVHAARLLISSRIGDAGLSAQSLAAQLGCHPDYLSQRFREHCGHGVAMAISRERIELAKELLAQGRLGIAEIAWACGFTRPAHFTARFKQLVGQTPSAWRREQG
jgi:AraC-like DNA-binding protein